MQFVMVRTRIRPKALASLLLYLYSVRRYCCFYE